MNALALGRLAVRNVVRNPMRSGLTMLGIVIGVAAVLVMVGIGEGAQAQIRQRIESLGTNLIVISPGAHTQGGVSGGGASGNSLTVDDVELLARESLMITAISPLIASGGQVIGGTGNWRAPIQGVSTDYAHIRDLTTSSGAFFDESAVRTYEKVAVLGKTVSDILFPESDPVGERVQLRNVPFTVIGVLDAKGQSADGTDMDDVILIPYTTLQRRLSGRQFIPMILASASSPGDIAPAQEELQILMREAHELASWEEDDFTVRNQSDLAETAEGTTEVMTQLLAAIAGVSLIVGGIGIMNIMLVSVTERTREIGIRIAVGARGQDVLRQFLVESVVMTLLGGCIGIATGFAGALVLSRFTGWSTYISPQAIAMAMGCSALVGIFFGYYPARRAAALDPIQALRQE